MDVRDDVRDAARLVIAALGEEPFRLHAWHITLSAVVDGPEDDDAANASWRAMKAVLAALADPSEADG